MLVSVAEAKITPTPSRARYLLRACPLRKGGTLWLRPRGRFRRIFGAMQKKRLSSSSESDGKPTREESISGSDSVLTAQNI